MKSPGGSLPTNNDLDLRVRRVMPGPKDSGAIPVRKDKPAREVSRERKVLPGPRVSRDLRDSLE